MLRDSSKSLWLASPADVVGEANPEVDDTKLNSLREVVGWAKDFLCNAHPELGREGAVCPFTPPSMKMGNFWMTSYQGVPSVERVQEVVLQYRDWFLELEPRTPPKDVLKTILVVFPEISDEQAPKVVDPVQETLKPDFVDEGLMIGQFHSHCEEPGLHNPDFRPLKSPVPLLAIRQMVPSDFLFLEGREKFVVAYLERVPAREIPKRLIPRVKKAVLKFDLDFDLS